MISPGARKKARRRRRLWEQQHGRCCYCRGEMALPPDHVHTKHQPENMATIEHLRDRLHPRRREPARNHEQRLALACKACNNARGNARHNTLPIEELRRRSRSGLNTNAVALERGETWPPRINSQERAEQPGS